jgi:retron-type reverse transcriptase
MHPRQLRASAKHVKDLYRKKTLALFLKLDIAKAFDSVSWAYLLEVLDNLGFGTRWRDWISLTLATSSSRILLNGILGRLIKHEHGLRQGDPISPMLFILAMDPLQRILHLATEGGVLHPNSLRSRGIKASLYADDTVIFVSPRKQDIAALKEILDFFWTSYRALHQPTEN